MGVTGGKADDHSADAREVSARDVGFWGWVAWIAVAVVVAGGLAFVAHRDASNQVGSEANIRSKQNQATQVANCHQQVEGRAGVVQALADSFVAAYRSAAVGAPFQLHHNSVIPDSFIDEINRQLAAPRAVTVTPEQEAAPAIAQLHAELPPLRCSKAGAAVPIRPPVIPTTTTAAR